MVKKCTNNKPKKLLLVFAVLGLTACGGDQSEKESSDEHPATGSFNDATKPKKIQSKPCSNYNLKFYEGDERNFNENIVRLGDSKSDAQIEINGHKVAILGFEGQAEEYINYSVYRGVSYDKITEESGSTLSTKTEMQIIVCFRRKVIAVKQLVEKVRARGQLSKAQYFTKQWLWRVVEK